VLQEVDTVYVPVARIGSRSVARTIVEEALEGKCIHFTELVFPMSRDRNELSQKWAENGRTVVRTLDAGKQAAFVTLGDPAIYSTYTYLLEALHEQRPEITVETIPGITTFTLAAAKLDIPLVIGDERMVLTPLPARVADLQEMLDRFDTLVVYKIGERLQELVTFLKTAAEEASAQGRRSYFVSRAGMEEEYICDDIDQLSAEVNGYLSTLIIKSRGEAKA
jgi:precorrin-2/cobalt-factor-2 C20-methyltransferase